MGKQIAKAMGNTKQPLGFIRLRGKTHIFTFLHFFMCHNVFKLDLG